MTFLNPLLLIGLVASAIPIILHLLNLRKLKTIEFSTLQFLKELQKTKMRRVKIRQWLLLVLRTLLIMAVVMAFSRPALRGSLAGFPLGESTHAKSTLILLLDDSPSMNVRNERGPLFSQAKEAASQIAGLMKDGDEAYLIRLSEVRHATTFTSAHTAGTIQSTLQSLTTSQETAPFRDALGVVAKILTDSRNFNQEIYLITDGQATQFVLPKAPADTADLFGENVRLFLADVRSGGTTEIENTGIESADITSKIITQNKPLSLEMTVRNNGPTALHNGVVSVYLDRARILQHSMDIGAHNSARTTLPVTPKRRGILEGYLQLEDDAFEADNKRFFAVNVPNAIHVLAVGASQKDTRLSALALTLDKDSTAAGLFLVEQIDESRLSSFDLSKYDILMFMGVKDFSTGEADRIAQFVTAGGGVLMFAGQEMDMANYNAVLFPKLGIPVSQPQRTLTTSSSYPPITQGSFLSFGKIDFEHPLFAGLFEQQLDKRSKQPVIESPRVYTAIQPNVGPRGRFIISLSDGSGFLTEYQRGSGRILLFSVEAGMTWSDFPLKGLFVPLLYRSGLYLAEAQPVQSYTVGDEIKAQLRLRNRTDKDVFVLRSPSGVDERIVPQISPVSGLATFVSRNSAEAGIYQLRKTSAGKDGELLSDIPLNIAGEESDLEHIRSEAAEQFFQRVGLKPAQIKHLSGSERIDTAILESRFGVELWKYFFILAVLLAICEMIIGREAKTEPSRESMKK